VRPIVLALLAAQPFYAADLQEIVARATAVIKSDWAADPDFAYVERDEVCGTGASSCTSSKTSRVVMIDDSDYYLPIAVNDQPLSPDRQKAELQKFRNEVERRKNESASARAQRIAKFKKEHDENGAILLDAPDAFAFELLREETINGHPAYALAATPKKRTGPLSRADKVLSGMHGTIWIERDTFHVVLVEADVVKPVPIYGILARVLPGTHIELDLTPANRSTWLVSRFSLTLALAKLVLFKSHQVTRSTYSDYQLNAAVLEDLLRR
jgi:hypothetical protein